MGTKTGNDLFIVDTHGGWPAAFSQNHPPPDAATLAAEQLAHQAQAKAQRKAAAAAKTAQLERLISKPSA